MNSKSLQTMIKRKKIELNRLVAQKQSLQDEEVYQKSCELDILVVDYMRAYSKKNANQEMKMRKAL